MQQLRDDLFRLVPLRRIKAGRLRWLPRWTNNTARKFVATSLAQLGRAGEAQAEIAELIKNQPDASLALFWLQGFHHHSGCTSCTWMAWQACSKSSLPNLGGDIAPLLRFGLTAPQAQDEVPAAKWSGLRYGLEGQLEDHDQFKPAKQDKLESRRHGAHLPIPTCTISAHYKAH